MAQRPARAAHILGFVMAGYDATTRSSCKMGAVVITDSELLADSPRRIDTRHYAFESAAD